MPLQALMGLFGGTTKNYGGTKCRQEWLLNAVKISGLITSEAREGITHFLKNAFPSPQVIVHFQSFLENKQLILSQNKQDLFDNKNIASSQDCDNYGNTKTYLDRVYHYQYIHQDRCNYMSQGCWCILLSRGTR